MEEKMQFEKCLTCPAIKEQRCAGPNYMAMSTKELVEWGNAYQKLHGITNAKLAEQSGVPKGTIDGISRRSDVRHDTIYHLIKALIEMTGGKWGGEPCAAVSDSSAEQQAEIVRLTLELAHEKDLSARYGRIMKWLTIAIFALFGLCLCLAGGLVLLNL